MNKDQDVKDARAKYIQDVVNKSKRTGKAIAKLAKELFLSEKTIERDSKKDI